MYPYTMKERKGLGWNRVLGISTLFLLGILVALPTLIYQKLPLSTAYLVSANAPWKTNHFYPVKNSIPDVVGQIIPWKILTIRQLKAGRIPLWNPYQFSGTPHLANVQSAVFSPLNFLFAGLSFPSAWSIMVLLQPLLAMILMYLFLSYLRFSIPAALIGSLSFGLGGFMTTWMAYATIGYALLPLPLALLAVEKLLASLKRGWFWVLAGSVAFSLLSGHFQTSLYLVLAVLVYLLARALTEPRKMLVVLGAVLIGFGLAGIQLGPAIEHYLGSLRAEQFDQQGFSQGLVAPLYLLTFVAPDYFGNPVTRNDYFGRYAEWQGFAGTITLGLAFLGVVTGDRRKKPFFWLLALSLLLAVRTFVPTLLVLARIPVLGTGNSNRALVLAPLALGGLAAVGIERLKKRWPVKVAELRPVLILTLVIVFMVLLPFFPKAFPGDPGMRKVAWRNLILPLALVFSLMVILILGRLTRLRAALILILIGLTVFDLWRYQRKWSPFGPNEWFYPSHPSITFLRRAQKDHPWRYLGTFGQAVSTPFGLYALDGYDPVNIGRYNQFVASLEDGVGESPNPAGDPFPQAGLYTRPSLDLMGVRYLVYRQGEVNERLPWIFPVWEHEREFGLIWEGHGYQVWQNLTVMPRAVVYPRTRPPGSVAELFKSNSFRNQLMIDGAGKLGLSAGSGQAAEAKIVSFQPQEIKVKTPDLNGFLFVSNPYFAGWQATVNGRPVKIKKANLVFQAVPVQGKSEVRFWYQPQSLKLGLMVSLFSLLTGLAVFWLPNLAWKG